MNEIFEGYKTPSYTRKAYKDYYHRNKENEEFISKRKKAQAEYYQRNKEKILEKKRMHRQKKKEEESIEGQAFIN